MSFSSSGGQLPRTVLPRRLSQQSAKLRGTLCLAQMERLSELLSDVQKQDVVQIYVSFYQDEECRPIVKGLFSAEVSMVCQRCLDTVELVIEAEPVLAVLHSDAQSENLPRCYEPLPIFEEELDLYTLIEDELLLALPLVPYHKDAGCGELNGTVISETVQEDQLDQHQNINPFSVLSTLRDG